MTDSFDLPPLSPPVTPSPPTRGLGRTAWMILGAIGIFIVVIGIALVRQNQPQPTSGQAPDFTVTTFDGQAFTLSAQRGTPVVVNFWASWCGPCREEAPALQRLSERYGERVRFLGITHADEPDDSRAFMAEYGITYPNADDPRDEVSKRLYRITGVPETFVVDANGEVAGYFYSAVDEAELAELLDRLTGSTS